MKSPNFTNTTTHIDKKTGNYNKVGIAASKREHARWEQTCNEMLIVWWSYMPRIPPLKSMPIGENWRYHDNELPNHTEWESHVSQTHQAPYCTACRQWFDDIPSTHQCGNIKKAGPICITTTPYA